MNKFLQKLAKIFLGLSMAAGVGVAIGAGSDDASPVQAASAEWQLVTSAPSDWSGEYIIASGSSGSVYMMDGSAFSNGGVCSGVSVTVSSSKITADTADALTIAKSSTSGKYTVMVNGYYIGKNANSNGIDASTTWSANLDNDISLSNGKVVIKGNGGRVLTWLTSNSNYKYYASSNNSSYLYKKIESKTLSSIVVSSNTHRTFVVNETFVKETITATYSDLSTADVTSSATFSGYNMAVAGNYTVSVSYTEGGTTKTTSYQISVKSLSGIAVTTPPTKTTYTDGQSFDPDGMTVTATYSDSSTADVTSSCTFSPDPLTQGTTSVTISYGGKTTTQAVTVNEAPGYAKITDLAAMDQVIITTVHGGTNYLLDASTTSTAPLVGAVTITNNKVVGADESNLFTVEKSGDTYAFKNSANKYLSVGANDNNGIRINSNSPAYWTITATTNGYKMTNNSRWCGVYNNASWRSYTTSNAANYGGSGGSGESINFYGTTKEVAPLDSIELRNYPESDVEIGYSTTLSYYGLDADAEQWTGDVTYTSSNTSAVTIDASTGEINAIAAGSSNITVYANAGENGAKVESDPVTITVLTDPVRQDLPVGNYSVTISAAGMSSSDWTPIASSYEIKAKEGSGSGRVWYKNLSVSCTDVTVAYSNEYSLAASTGAIAFTNNSNAKITTISIDWYISGNYAESDVYVGSSVTPASHSTGTGGSGTVYVYALNTTESTIRISNPSGSYRSSFYSLTINFEVADESEEFHSLVVAKSNSWSTATNGTYKDGNAPSNSGLVVTANFTTDGQTISRSEDVTALVSDWTYNKQTLTTSDTSFTVIATWDGHDSNTFTVTNIVVNSINGDLGSGGKFFIYTDNGALENRDYTNGTSDKVEITTTSAWTFTLVDDDTYTISNGSNFMYPTASNTGLRTHNQETGWTVSALTGDDEGKFEVYTSDGTDDRWLCDFVGTKNDWRTYKSSAKGDMYKLFIVEEKEVFSNNFLESFTAGCSENGGYDSSLMDWTSASTQYGTLSDANKTIFEEAEYTLSGSGSNTQVIPATGVAQEVAEAVARYDYIVGKYGTSTFADFMHRNPPSIGGVRILLSTMFGKNSNTVAIIVIISMVSVTAIGGYFFLRKRKENI